MEGNYEIKNISNEKNYHERKISTESTTFSVSQSENFIESNIIFTEKEKKNFEKINFFSGIENYFKNEFPEKFLEYKSSKNYILKSEFINSKNSGKNQENQNNGNQFPCCYFYYPFFGVFCPPQQYNNIQLNFYISQKKEEDKKIKENEDNKTNDNTSSNTPINIDNNDILIEEDKKYNTKNYYYRKNRRQYNKYSFNNNYKYFNNNNNKFNRKYNNGRNRYYDNTYYYDIDKF